MNQSLFKTFKSPYRAWSLSSKRYRRALIYLFCLIVSLPVLFLPFRSFSIYLISQIITFILFPIFLWVFLNTDQLTDIKLDILKLSVMMPLYFSYLIILCWLMVWLFQPKLKMEYIFLNLGYIALLIIVTIIVTAIFFYHRYAQKIIRQS